MPDVKITAVPSKDSITVEWTPELAEATFGRDGKDASGYGPWTSAKGQRSPQRLTRLKPDTEYTVTVAGKLGVRRVTEKVVVRTLPAQDQPVTPAPQPETPPVTPPVTQELKLSLSATSDTIRVDWSPELTDAQFGRDGFDRGKYGPWMSQHGAKSGSVLTNLMQTTNYTITVRGMLGGRFVSAFATMHTSTPGTLRCKANRTAWAPSRASM